MAGGVKYIGRSSVHRICSGQVITSLAAAVKELVENALDAGATSIEIRLKEHGSASIEVADNGPGIRPEDYQTVTLKHHTSKISEFSDLQSVSTLGFRGEALSSLCCVASVSIITRCANQNVGTRLEYDREGTLVARSAVPRAPGTTVLVKDIFGAMPVRHKELQRNLRREYSKLLTVVQAYAVISTRVRVLCTNHCGQSGRSTAVSTKQDATLKDNMVVVFGSKMVEGLQAVEIEISDGCRISGFVSQDPNKSAGRNAGANQFLYLNGRPVDLPKVVKVLNETFRSLTTVSRMFVRPMAVLDIQVPTELADVNVTPDKRKVFLQNEGHICESLQTALQQTWESSLHKFQPQTGVAVREEVGADLPSPHFCQSDSSKEKPKPAAPVDFMPMQSQDPGEDVGFGSRLSGTKRKAGSGPHGKMLLVDRMSSRQASVTQFFASQSPETDRSGHSLHQSCGKVCQTAQVQTGKPGDRNEGHVAFPQPGMDTSCTVADKNVSEPATVKASNASVLALCSDQCHELAAVSGGVSGDADGSKDVAMSAVDASVNSCQRASGAQHISGESMVMDKAAERGGLAFGLDSEFTMPHPKPGQGPLHEHPEHSCGAETLGQHGDRLWLPSVKKLCPAGPTNCEAQEEVDLPLCTPTSQPIGSHQCAGMDKVQQVMGTMHSSPSRPGCHSAVNFDLSQVREVWHKKMSLDKKCHAQKPATLFSASSIQLCPSDMLPQDREAAATEELARIFQKNDFASMDVIGQFNKGFVLAKLRNEVFILDQHASDEKHNFERLLENEVLRQQNLLKPIPLNLPVAEEFLVKSHEEIFARNGFHFVDSPNGQGLLLSTVPVGKNVVFGPDDVADLVSKVADGDCGARLLGRGFEITDETMRYVPRPSRVRAMFAMQACRSSIMIGKSLSQQQMEQVVKNLGKLEAPWNCPHGRPTMRHLCSLPQQR
eukprot:evm.model.scf_3988EXC.1 EVM.evm.TU.scf_3988EXC.1   scf_3988EXC:5716-8547(+)